MVAVAEIGRSILCKAPVIWPTQMALQKLFLRSERSTGSSNFLYRKNLDSLDFVRSQLDHNAMRACNLMLCDIWFQSNVPQEFSRTKEGWGYSPALSVFVQRLFLHSVDSGSICRILLSGGYTIIRWTTGPEKWVVFLYCSCRTVWELRSDPISSICIRDFVKFRPIGTDASSKNRHQQISAAVRENWPNLVEDTFFDERWKGDPP